MTEQVTIYATHLPDSAFVTLDCTECGPMGMFDEPGPFVYRHLKEYHGCNMDTVDINHLDTPEE